MLRVLRSLGLTAVLAFGAAWGPVAAVQTASADTQICAQFGSTSIAGGRYIVQNNRWGTSATQCINVTSTGFNVTQADGSNATNGAPKAYPSVYYGCHFGNCSSRTILPLQATSSSFSRITTSVGMTYPNAGTFDAAYDIWFDPTARTNGQNTGAEIMVWLNHQGPIQPVGSLKATVSLNGATWNVWEGNTGWNVVSYVRQSTTGSVSFPVSTFLNDAVSRGFAQTSWFLTSIQAGFEPWVNGVGLTVNSFSVTTPGGGGGSATCSAAFSVTNSWSTGFQGAVMVTDTGTTPINGWTASWTFPSGQTISQLWNGTLTQNGSRESVTNTSSNGQIPAGGSTSFGFIGSGSAPSSLSTTCASP
jgi:Glycosyl hydrolase family 12/Cellulose binding domain